MKLGKEKAKQILFSGLVVIPAIFLVWCFYNFSPQALDLRKLKTQSSELNYDIEFLKESELPQKKNQAKNMIELRNLLNEAFEKISLVEKKLPSQKNLGPFFSELTQISKESFIDFFKISSGDTKKGLNFSEIPIEIELKSDFFALVDYLEKLESFNRLVNVKTFEVELDQNESFLVKAKIKVSIFML